MPLAVALATAADILEAAEAEYSPPLKDALVFRWPLGPHFPRDGCFSSGVLGGGLFRGGGGGSYPRFSRGGLSRLSIPVRVSLFLWSRLRRRRRTRLIGRLGGHVPHGRCRRDVSLLEWCAALSHRLFAFAHPHISKNKDSPE